MAKKKVEVVFTEDYLRATGWTKTDDQVFPWEKKIENRNPINNDPDDSDIKLVIHGMYNVYGFAVLLPDGGMLNFNAYTHKELTDFENAINFYDPPY